MKKLVFICVFAVLAISSAFAQVSMKVANHLGVDVNVGTTGTRAVFQTDLFRQMHAQEILINSFVFPPSPGIMLKILEIPPIFFICRILSR